METKTCLDLFAGLGGFSAAFVDSPEWDVVTVDIGERFDPDIQADVMDLRPSDLPDASVVLASPPCKLFSVASSRGMDQWDSVTHEPTGPEAKDAVALVYHTLGLIEALSPHDWFLENPRGRMRWVLGEPTGAVTYCQYGHPHQKPTDLWGDHPSGITYRNCSPGGSCHEENPHEANQGYGTSMQNMTPAQRAKVPYELSNAILQAVEGRGEQTTLEGVTAN